MILNHNEGGLKKDLWSEYDSVISIYKIVNLNNQKYYIGSSKETGVRLRRHLRDLKNGKHHCPHLQRAWMKYGEKSFVFDIVQVFDNVDLARLAEQEVFDSEKKFLLYNTSLKSTGGDLLSYHPDKEAICQKISEGLKKYHDNLTDEERNIISERFSGENNPMFQHIYSEETLQKLSLPRPNLSKALKGKPKSDSHRKKLSEVCSDGRRKGENNSFYGKTHSVETRALLKEKLKGLKPPNCKKVLLGNLLFNSATDAARYLGVATATITWRIKSNNLNFADYKWYEDEDLSEITIVDSDSIKNTYQKPEKTNGKRQHSLKSKKLMSENKKSVIPTNTRKVLIDNQNYASISEASRKLGISSGVIKRRCVSSECYNYHFLDS